jgi:hypothetical protein
MNIPAPQDITARWLTERLREGGHSAADVRSFTTRRIGTGQIGLCIRYELELTAPDAATPRSLVGKFPSDDPVSRATGVQLRNYYREVRFYQELVQRLGITTPRCYYAEIEGEGPEFMLLLEDLRPAEQGDQLLGCDEVVAEAAVLELVGLHAPSWNDASLLDVDWIGAPSEESRGTLQQLYASLLPGFLDRYGAQLEPDEAAIIARVAEAPRAPLFDALAAPYALVHVDYRLDNLLIDRRFAPPRIAVVDWQSITLGRPLSDVAYFLGAGLVPDRRRPVEQQIVRAYHRALSAARVTGYDWEQCWADYRRGTFAGFGVTVIASMLVQQTPRGDEMFTVMARRHSRHAIDLGAGEFLD